MVNSGTAGVTASTASSVDGRTFVVSDEDSTSKLSAGDLVVLTSADGDEQLGQILVAVRRAANHGVLEAEGILIGVLDADGAPRRNGRHAFTDGSVRPAIEDDRPAFTQPVARPRTIGVMNAHARSRDEDRRRRPRGVVS